MEWADARPPVGGEYLGHCQSCGEGVYSNEKWVRAFDNPPRGVVCQSCDEIELRR